MAGTLMAGTLMAGTLMAGTLMAGTLMGWMDRYSDELRQVLMAGTMRWY